MKNKMYKAAYYIIKAIGDTSYVLLVVLFATIVLVVTPAASIQFFAEKISFAKALVIVLVFYAAIIALYFLCNGLEKVYKKGKKLVEEEKVH